MRRILSSAFAAVAMLAMTVSASANFVVDDYTNDALGTQTVFSEAGFTIDRAFVGANWSATGNPLAQFQLTSTGAAEHSITYTVGGGNTFGDIFDSVVSTADFVDGFNLGFIVAGGYDVTVSNDAGFNSGPIALVNSDSPLDIDDLTGTFDNATSITLDFNGGDFPGQFLFVGSPSSAFVATPEPTSLLLFGSVLGAVALRRRKG